MKTISFTEQEWLNLDDLLKQALEEKFLSATTRKIIEQIITKLEE